MRRRCTTRSSHPRPVKDERMVIVPRSRAPARVSGAWRSPARTYSPGLALQYGSPAMKPGTHYNAADEFVDRHVRDGRGARPAFIDRSRILSYATLHDAVTRVGPALATLGVEREMRIALIMHDCVEFPILFWGAIRAGIVPVLLNTRLTSEQYRYVLTDCRARVAFVSQPLLDTINAAASTVPFLTHLVPAPPGPEGRRQLESLLFAHAPAAAADTCADEVAYWQYSSGSTGRPKGVMRLAASSPIHRARPCRHAGPGHSRRQARGRDWAAGSASAEPARAGCRRRQAPCR